MSYRCRFDREPGVKPAQMYLLSRLMTKNPPVLNPEMDQISFIRCT